MILRKIVAVFYHKFLRRFLKRREIKGTFNAMKWKACSRIAEAEPADSIKVLNLIAIKG
jgi:hypothetical protein